MNEVSFFVFILCIITYAILMMICYRKGKYNNRSYLNLNYKNWVDARIDDMDHIVTIQAIRNSIMANSIFISALLLFLSILLGLFDLQIIGDIDIDFLGSATISVGLVQMTLIGTISVISLYNFVFSVRMLHRSQFLITANTKKREDISHDAYEMIQKTFLTAQNHWMLGIRCLFFLFPSITWLLNPIVFLISTILLTLYLIGWHDLTLFQIRKKRK